MIVGGYSMKKKYLKKAIEVLIFLFMPFLFISTISYITKLATLMINTSEVIITFQKEISLGDYIYYYLVVLGTEVTFYFSNALLQVSKKSNKLAEAINEKEEIRSAERIRDCAAYVYMDLKRLIDKSTEIMIHYATENLRLSSKSFDEKEESMKAWIQFRYLGNISTDWKLNIAKLRGELKKNDINYEELLDLYLKFETPIVYANEQKIRACVVSIPREIFCNEFVELWRKIDNVSSTYSDIYINYKSDGMEKNDKLMKCIHLSEEYEKELERLKTNGVLNEKWLEILRKLEKIASNNE